MERRSLWEEDFMERRSLWEEDFMEGGWREYLLDKPHHGHFSVLLIIPPIWFH